MAFITFITGIFKLDQVLNGDLDEIIDALTLADQAARLERQA